MHRHTHTCAHMQSPVSRVMMTVISLSLETDILNNIQVFSFNMFSSVFPLCKVKGKEDLGFFFFVFVFSLKSAWGISVNIGMISMSGINPIALLMCNFSSLHPVNIDS